MENIDYFVVTIPLQIHHLERPYSGHFKITTWLILILIRAIRVLRGNPSNPQSDGIRPMWRLFLSSPGTNEIKRKRSKEEEKRKARGLPLSLPRPNGARYRRFRPQQAFGVSHEKVGGKKGRAAKKKRKGRLVDFHCPCPAPMEPGTGASVHNKRSGWAMKKLGEKREEQQRRREKEGSWTSTVPAPPQWGQVQALPSTTSVRGEPWKSWGKKGKSSKEEEKRKARGLPLSLPRPNGARYRRFRPQQAFGVSHEKVGEKREEQQRRREKECLVNGCAVNVMQT